MFHRQFSSKLKLIHVFSSLRLSPLFPLYALFSMALLVNGALRLGQIVFTVDHLIAGIQAVTW